MKKVTVYLSLFLTLSLSLSMYVYIYVCVCVCVLCQRTQERFSRYVHYKQQHDHFMVYSLHSQVRLLIIIHPNSASPVAQANVCVILTVSEVNQSSLCYDR